jgi:hypothetical protein
MTSSAKLICGVIGSALIAASVMTVAFAQTQTPETHGATMPDQGTEFGQPGMMGRNMMRSGMMGGMPMSAMRGHMMKFMFAVADADGDNALSFDEVTTIHKRIFDKVDGDKNGKVTQEEMRSFMLE